MWFAVVDLDSTLDQDSCSAGVGTTKTATSKYPVSSAGLEHVATNHKVVGSNPTQDTKKNYTILFTF